MDISISLKSLRRWIAGIGIATIISSLIVVPTALAANFWDDAYAALSDAGVVTEEKASSPLSRCAFAKMVVSATLGEVEDPEESQYSDVAVTDACAPFIVAGGDAGYWEGYPDGTFRPNKTLNRWEMMKILVSALGLDVLEGDDASGALEGFEDGGSAPDWAEGYAAAAVDAELITGKDVGGKKFLAGGEVVNRGQGFVVTNRVMESTGEGEGEEGEGEEGEEGEAAEGEGEEGEPAEGEGEDVVTPPAPSGGDLAVALSLTSPAQTVLADGTAYNKMLVVTFTAAQDVNVTGLKLTREGIATDANIAGVLVQDAAGKRHGNVVTLSERVAEISFSSDPIKVAANTPAEVTILANLGAGLDSSTVGFSIKVAADVTSTATTVTGLFPITGSVFTTVNGAGSVGSFDPDIIVLGNAARTVDIGVKDYEVARFALAAGSNEHIYVKKLTVYNNGNAADGDVKNIRLKGMTSGNTLSTLETTASKYAIFDLSATPFKIEKGRTENIQIVVDVVSGATRTVQFRILNDYDFELTGDTGSGILAATGGAGTDTAFPIGDDNGGANATTINSISMNGGTLLTSRDTTAPSGNVSQGAKNQVLGTWKVEAVGEDIEVRKVCFDLDTGGQVTNENDAFSGTIKIQKSSGTSVYSFTPAAQTTHVDATCGEVTLSSYFTVKAGTTETLSLVADILSTLAANTTLTSEFAVNEYKRADTNDIVTGGGNANAIASNTLTVQVATLTVTSNPSFSSATIVKGSPKTKLGSFTLQAGAAEGINIQTIAITVDNDATRTAADTDTLAGITNLRLCKAGTTCETTDDQYGSTVANPAGTAAGNSFSVSGKLNLDASASVTIDAYADLSTTAPGSSGETTVTPFFQAASVTFVGKTSNASNSTFPLAITALQTMTLVTTGTLTIQNPVQSKQKVLHAGETGAELLSIQFSTQYEPIVIEKLLLSAINGGGNISNLTLKDAAGATVKSGIGFSNNKATISGLSITIPKDTATTYKVYGDATATGVMDSGNTVELRFGSVDARGQSSNTPLLETSYVTETLIDSANSVTHFKRGDVVLKSEAANTPATNGLAVLDANEDLDLVPFAAATNVAGTGTAAADDVIAKITPTSTGTTTITTNVSSIAMVLGDVIMVALDNAAYQWGIVTTASNAGAQPTAGLEGAAPAALTIATSGTISKFTPTSTSAMTAANPPVLTQGMTFVIGDVVFVPTALNAATHGWQVVTVAETIGAGAATAGTVRLNGANTYINGNMSVVSRISKFTPLTTEVATTIGTTTATNSYNTGDIVYLYDGNTDADDGLFVVKTPVRAGDTWAATSLGVGATLTNSSVISKVFSTTSMAKSNVFTVHDVEPVITKSATALSTSSVLESTQDAAIFDITASGTRNLFITRLDLLCTGGGAANTGLNNNAMEVKVDGTVLPSSTTQAEGAAGCDAATAANGRPYGLVTPLEIAAGTTKSFLVRFDTSATAGQWSTGETLLFRINGTEGRSGGGFQWYYTSPKATAPTNIPTLASPATMTDYYPIDGPTLTK